MGFTKLRDPPKIPKLQDPLRTRTPLRYPPPPLRKALKRARKFRRIPLLFSRKGRGLIGQVAWMEPQESPKKRAERVSEGLGFRV